MRSTQAAWSFWDRLGQRHDFHDSLNAPIDDVITALMDMEQHSGNAIYPGTTVDIRPEMDGYQFRIAINERHTHVVASGRVWQDGVTHWEGSIRNGWRWAWLSLYFTVFGGLLLLSLVSSPMQFEWSNLLVPCVCLFVGVYFRFISALGRNLLRGKLVQILDMFNA